jgi:hypothetical protein
MLVYVPPLAGGQLTVTWACAIPGNSKRDSKIANAEALKTRFFLKAMLLFVVVKAANFAPSESSVLLASGPND